jgi:5,10-methylene-tetrahydrofolate dehydrogenase/methenyl tetrahydrofolate cyclohydrolase
VIREYYEKEMEKIGANKKNKSVCIITDGIDQASRVYIKHKVADMTKCGINVIVKTIDIDEIDIEQLVADGYKIIIQQPCKLDLLDKVPLVADIDGLSLENRGRIALGIEPYVIPATARGIIDYLILSLNVSLEDKNVLIINRSKLVGEPLARILERKYNANVTVCHSKTSKDNLLKLSNCSDIVIVAVGIEGFIDCQFSNKPLYIDVGINMGS